MVGLAGLVQRLSRPSIQYMHLKAALQAMVIECDNLCYVDGTCASNCDVQACNDNSTIPWSARCLWHGPRYCSSCHEHNLDETTIRVAQEMVGLVRTYVSCSNMSLTVHLMLHILSTMTIDCYLEGMESSCQAQLSSGPVHIRTCTFILNIMKPVPDDHAKRSRHSAL